MLAVSAFWLVYPAIEWTFGHKESPYFPAIYAEDKRYQAAAVVPFTLALVGLACSATAPVTITNVPRRPRGADRPE